MKKTPKNYFLAVLFSVLAFGQASTAQKLNKDALAFTKSYQDNYNKGDLPALMDMYTNEITMLYGDGKSEKLPKSEFEADYIRDFGESGGTHLQFTVANTEKLANGNIKITGSFDGYDYDRKSMAKLNPTTGDFEEIITHDGGKWQFTQIKIVYTMEQVYRDVRKLAQDFQDAFNREDATALKALFTAEGVRISQDGSATRADAIEAGYASQFKASDAAVIIKLASVRPQFDGSMIAVGTYSVYGLSAAGDRIALNGSYTNKVVKENGQWKLAEVKEGGLVKTIGYSKVPDFAKWKAGFDAFRRTRQDAGELSFEVGSLLDDPNTVYVISEWASVEKARAFFASDELAASRKKAGLTDELHVLYLDKK